MAAVPPSLKKIKVFLNRAEELDRDKNNPESRVVAYNFRQYAVLTGIPFAGKDGDAKTYLGQLLNQLEKEKDAMSVFSKDEHWKICRKVADRVFDKADAEDRAGMATKGTAKTFYTASNFYEILQQFYGLPKEGDVNADDDDTKGHKEEEGKRRLYCKWKATDILNAIKEGRTPAPGGCMEEDSENVDIPSITPAGFISSSITQDFPPAPSMPSAIFSNELGTGEVISQSKIKDYSAYVPVPPPAYDGFELNLTGDPTPAVNDGDDDSAAEDIFIQGSTKIAATITTREKNLFFDDTPLPPYARTNPHNTTQSFPPPAANKPLPSPIAASHSMLSSTGIMSPQYGKSSSSSTQLSKEKLADAIELTKFALAALQKGDADLGRERLEQALALWRR
jgi:vacuolar protein sorting-associated protein VTA1